MSADTLTIVISAVGIVLSLGAGLFTAGTWMVRRIDDRIDGLDTKLTTRIDTVEEKLADRIDTVAADVADLKVAVARLEGPPRHLLAARP